LSFLVFHLPARARTQVRWISQNWEHYQEQHLVALVASGVGARMRPKQKSGLVAQVRALYDAAR
jgi:hypothetical protein